MMMKHRGWNKGRLTSDVAFKPLRKQQLCQFKGQVGGSGTFPKVPGTQEVPLEGVVDGCCHGNRGLRLTCLKLCRYSLQAVSTVNLVLKMLQSLAP